MTALDAKIATLLDRLAALPSLAVAFSGGVDSALVLAAAVRSVGSGRVADRVLAVTAVSDSLAAEELDAARRFALSLGVRHLLPGTAETANPGYRANGRDRCYFCKSEVLDVIGRVAADHGFAHVATGTNADDAADPFRPGIRAADERGVLAPLRDAGLTKAEVRWACKAWDLTVWDKPAAPCLASRVAYGVEVTPARLHRVETAERAVRRLLAGAGLTVTDLRVRDLGDRARVELDADLLPRASGLPGLVPAVREAGFHGAQVDVAVFRSGVLNIEPLRP
ncbi:ATP-dependent sacrificial sulfur transferase LarE [Streptosporangium sp. NPDC049078]|uniref:ATP-dependent sacrificial sulfur transferase LarE n=1 Tax=Streptosporangium sp. NPDC049078 TaxID=3155767 RepID=UPI0034376DE4